MGFKFTILYGQKIYAALSSHKKVHGYIHVKHLTNWSYILILFLKSRPPKHQPHKYKLYWIRHSGCTCSRRRRMFHLWLFTIKLIYLFFFVAGQNNNNTQALLDYRYACLDQSSVPPTTTTTYQTNLNNLISSLSSDSATSNGFGNRTSGSDDQNNMVYGLYLCRGDVNTSLCHSCVQNSSRLLKQHCPNNASAILWYPFCLLR